MRPCLPAASPGALQPSRGRALRSLSRSLGAPQLVRRRNAAPQPRSTAARVAAAAALGDMAEQLLVHFPQLVLADLPGICFDPACQREMDRAFVTAITLPLLALAAAVAYLLRPLPQDKVDSGELFEDSTTGTVFEAPPGAEPERDRLGELAFRAISYTPWPVEAGAEGERIRIDVGPPAARQPRTYLFSKTLRQPSQLVTVTLERPLGIVFEEDVRKKRAFVAGFVPGGHAEQQMRRSRLDPALAARAPQEGDVLRATTCTNIIYKTGALFFGAQKPERSIVLFGADGQSWPAVIAALKKGLVSDGPVTLVLERPLQQPAPAAGAAGGRGQQQGQQQAQQLGSRQ